MFWLQFPLDSLADAQYVLVKWPEFSREQIFLELGKPHGGLTTLSLGSTQGEVRLCRALGQRG